MSTITIGPLEGVGDGDRDVEDFGECRSAEPASLVRPRQAIAQRGRPKKPARSRQSAIPRRIEHYIHALVDAIGNPLDFVLTGGQAHALQGVDHLLPAMAATTRIADKAYDAEARVLEPLAAAGKTAVIPPRSNRRTPRDFDRHLYKARHLIENFFDKLQQFRAIVTRYDKTSRNVLAGVHLAAITVWMK